MRCPLNLRQKDGMPSNKLPDPIDDGLCIPKVKDHSRDKHHFLARYVSAFTRAMHKKKWSGLHYVDLFAGAGIERLEESGKLSLGSPMIAANAFPRFSRLHLCELKKVRFAALKKRILESKQPTEPQILNGDANDCVSEIVASIPRGTLTLAFLDPYGLHLDFETIRRLSSIRADLIIFFPDRLDALRNWKLNYHDDPDSNLDIVLGKGAAWRPIFEQEPKCRWAEKLRELYVSKIRTIGYRFFDYERISANGQPIYQLIFCSKDEAGAKIWRGTAQKKPDNQNTFDFGA